MVGGACLSVALATIATPGNAQNWVYEPDTAAVVGRPVELAPVQRTTTYRTVIPQSRGRAPIVRERIVTETYGAAPVVRERPAPVVRAPVEADYAYSPATSAYAMAPGPEPVVVVPERWPYRYDDRWSYRYDRRVVVDPVTGRVFDAW
jgi:hypothetical protein